MMVDLPRIILPFLIACLQMVTGALIIGLFPALWIIGSRKHYLMLLRWIIFLLVCAVAVAYGLPKAMTEWRIWVKEGGFKLPAMYMGYFVGLLIAFFVIPEPRRIAQNRLRHERRRLPRRGYEVD